MSKVIDLRLDLKGVIRPPAEKRVLKILHSMIFAIVP